MEKMWSTSIHLRQAKFINFKKVWKGFCDKKVVIDMSSGETGKKLSHFLIK